MQIIRRYHKFTKIKCISFKNGRTLNVPTSFFYDQMKLRELSGFIRDHLEWGSSANIVERSPHYSVSWRQLISPLSRFNCSEW